MEPELLKELADALHKPSDSVLNVLYVIARALIAEQSLNPAALRARVRRAAQRMSDEHIHTRNTLLRFAARLPASGRSRKAQRIR